MLRDAMDQTDIQGIRALLASRPRPVGWEARRARLDEVGSTWPVAADVELAAVDLDGVAGEWSIIPGSDAARVLIFFHGGGYCSGSVLSVLKHRIERIRLALTTQSIPRTNKERPGRSSVW